MCVNALDRNKWNKKLNTSGSRSVDDIVNYVIFSNTGSFLFSSLTSCNVFVLHSIMAIVDQNILINAALQNSELWSGAQIGTAFYHPCILGKGIFIHG